METISENLNYIQKQIAIACKKSGRKPDQVRLLAVSKTKPASAVVAAINGGQLLFGENRVQEARDKISLVAEEVDSTNVEWHLIGPLQRNKVKVAVNLFTMVHSVDSVDLAIELNRRALKSRPMPVLVQVNVGREPQKSGFLAEAVTYAIKQMAELPGIKVKGLMTIPPATDSAEEARPYFRELAQLAKTINGLKIPGIDMAELSMGMSHDYMVAVEEGATLVRVGSAMFGARDYNI
ncbi:MAG: YggS family pyridoxal phosphate-dependent enzyme [Magnetococcales bacterium]|nr:YggS family pyridoxal phosphate-dependent enzyme [Magnetococcales bacterium]